MWQLYQQSKHGHRRLHRARIQHCNAWWYIPTAALAANANIARTKKNGTWYAKRTKIRRASVAKASWIFARPNATAVDEIYWRSIPLVLRYSARAWTVTTAFQNMASFVTGEGSGRCYLSHSGIKKALSWLFGHGRWDQIVYEGLLCILVLLLSDTISESSKIN